MIWLGGIGAFLAAVFGGRQLERSAFGETVLIYVEPSSLASTGACNITAYEPRETFTVRTGQGVASFTEHVRFYADLYDCPTANDRIQLIDTGTSLILSGNGPGTQRLEGDSGRHGFATWPMFTPLYARWSRDPDGLCVAVSDNVEELARIPNCFGPLPIIEAADFDRDGRRTVRDLFDFLAAWGQMEPRADITGEGEISQKDVYMFLEEYLR